MSQKTTPLRTFREAAGLNQTELAKASGVSQRAISAIETGVNKYPSYPSAVKLSEVLGCKPERLMGFDEPKPKVKAPSLQETKLEELRKKLKGGN